MALRILVRGLSLTMMVRGYNSLGGLAIDEIMSQQYGGHLQFLTIQGLALACLTMTTSLLYEAFPLSILRTTKRYLMVMAMPLSVVISTIYWSLVTVFPHLILQASSPSESSTPSSSPITPELFHIPLSIDLALHAVPCISLLIDFFIFEKKYNKQEVKVGAPIAAIGFSLWYTLWVEHCARMNNGIFPYPFLTENTLKVRIGIYIGATLIAILSLKLINHLHS
ncbi:UPF0641 membrane protein [Psilocybe cubensis]|uniref:FAR-17a/AIG1-like protein n=2 Tax=Psilocybe cubensis TaxID=181762 RepID=A0A8H8CND3_PSICU|nr:UPF0641 membrane protein [Psilocybe cubensis]KAH9484250.1 UPF0641 membrane protein [Psilocybe cubensis]